MKSRKPKVKPHPPENPRIQKIGVVSNESVWKHTRKGWDEWVDILESTAARGWPHKEIAAFLKKKYRLTPWWQHVVAGAYEIHIGRKDTNRNEKGLYSLTATKMVGLPRAAVWKALTSPEGQAAWLRPLSPIPFRVKTQFEAEGGYFGEIRTMKAPERVRLSWREEAWSRASYLQVYVAISQRSKQQTMIVIGHEGLPDQATMNRLRARWKQGILDLIAHLEENTKKKKPT